MNMSVQNSISLKTIINKIKKISIVISIEKYKFSKLKKTLLSIKKWNYTEKIDIFIFSYEKVNRISNNIKENFINESVFVFKIKNNFCETVKENLENFSDYVFFINSGDTISIDFIRKMQMKIYENQANIIFTRYAKIKNKNVFIYNDQNFLEYLKIEKNNFFTSFISTENKIKELNNIFGKLVDKNILKKAFCDLKMNKEISLEQCSLMMLFMIFNNSEKIDFLEQDLYFLNNKFTKSNLKNEIEEIIYIYDFIEKNISKKHAKKIKNWKLNSFFNALNKYKEKKINLYKYISRNDYLSIEGINDEKSYQLVPILGNIWDNWKLKKKIYKHQIISFDIFDTLILRNFWEPTDLFEILNYKINKLTKIKDFFDFKQIRIIAEKEVRKKYKREITIDEIYEKILSILPFEKKIINEIKLSEIDLEIKYSQKRQIAYELFSYAVFLGKKIYITSDMYLDESSICKILNKSGYHLNDIDKIFVSSKIKKSKSENNIWDFIVSNEKIKKENIMHIGDNYFDDYIKPKKEKIDSFWLPKTTDLLMGKTKYHSSNLFKFLNSNSSIFRTLSWKTCFGAKTLFSLVANKFYDNPFKITTSNTDFENSPYLFGFFALGLFMISVTNWLIEIQKEKKYKIFNFNLRDGYLFKIFFDKIALYENIKVKTNFTYFSRNSLFPILFICEKNNNKISLANYFFNFLHSRNATYLIEKLKNVISDRDYENLNNKFKNFEIKNVDNLLTFVKFLYENNVNVDENKFPWKKFKFNYLKKFFSNSKNSTALFDIGYSGRISSILKETFNIEFDEYYINCENDKAFQRKNKNNIKIKTFYDFSPNLNGWLRESIVSFQGEGCTNFRYENNNFIEEFNDSSTNNFWNDILINIIQKGAIDILNESLKIYHEDFKLLHANKMELCIPLEYFYNYSSCSDRNFFKNIIHENDFDWHNQNEKEIENKLKNKWNENFSNKSNFYKILQWSEMYQKLSKLKKILFFLLIDKQKLFNIFLNFIKIKLRKKRK